MQLCVVVVFFAVACAVYPDYFDNITEWRRNIKHHKTRVINRVTRKHTLETYENPQPGCDIEYMTDEERKLVVDIHNAYRRKVSKGLEKRGFPGPQPKARNMVKMVYDINLEIVAMLWVSQCRNLHDIYRDIDGQYVGQNIVMEQIFKPSKFEKIDWKRIIRKAWYHEVKYFAGKEAVTNFTNKNGRTSHQVHHYAEMVNANSTRIGCAHAVYNRSFFRGRQIVCNYRQGVLGHRPLYLEGEPCADVNETECDDGLLVIQ